MRFTHQYLGLGVTLRHAIPKTQRRGSGISTTLPKTTSTTCTRIPKIMHAPVHPLMMLSLRRVVAFPSDWSCRSGGGLTLGCTIIKPRDGQAGHWTVCILGGPIVGLVSSRVGIVGLELGTPPLFPARSSHFYSVRVIWVSLARPPRRFSPRHALGWGGVGSCHPPP